MSPTIPRAAQSFARQSLTLLESRQCLPQVAARALERSATRQYSSQGNIHHNFRRANLVTTEPSIPLDVIHSSTNRSLRSYSSSTIHLQDSSSSSPFATTTTTSSSTSSKRIASPLIPRKAAVQLTDRARTLFQKLLASKPDKDGILLDYHQSSSGQPRMVFSFRFVTKDELVEEDEGVTLEVMENEKGDGTMTPLSPQETWNDGKPKLYVHHNAFMKVLGAKVDVDAATMTPILYDREGNEMDPNV